MCPSQDFQMARVRSSPRKRHSRSAVTALVTTDGTRRTSLPTLSATMFNTLLVPLDGSPQSAHVVDLASRVAAPGTATIHLLCVVDPSYFLSSEDENGAACDGLEYPPAHEQTAFAQSVLAAAATQFAGQNLTVEQHVCAGSPAEAVIEQAQLLAAEVIVMGHHHLSRLGRWANPSTCQEVIDQSPCAVLVETRDTN
jgi:nucleotide-binding universal stress UspA family protein